MSLTAKPEKCRGTNRTTGKPCGNWSLTGSAYCKFHGGRARKGILNPNWKGGKYSKFLPVRLQDGYNEAQSDPEILALRESISLLETRLTDVLRRVDTGEAGALWREMNTAYRELRRAMKAQDPQAITIALADMESAIGKGMADYAAWNEVYRVLEQKRRLTESERKRLLEMNQVISTDQAMGLISYIVESIKRNVGDKRARRSIMDDLQALLNKPGSPPVFEESAEDTQDSAEDEFLSANFVDDPPAGAGMPENPVDFAEFDENPSETE